MTNSFKLATQQAGSRRDYWRDGRDRITAWKKTETGRGDRYSYDAEGQLTNASYQALTPEANPTGALRGDNFTYDALGNRVRSNWVASRGWMDFARKDNGLNQYRAWWNYSIINYDDDIPGWGAPAAANGVIMQDGWITAGFNALNQPLYIWSTNVGWTNFGYDPLGRCVKRWAGPAGGAAGSNPATYLYYDGWSLVQEGTSAASPTRLYVHGNRLDEIVASQTGGAWNYHHYDARGHCILLTGPGGNVIEQYEYDAFGQPYFYNGVGYPLPNGSSYGNRFLFTGREWLSDLKLYDYRARMYQPELGRFLQPDPKQFAAGDYNLYRYCHNDPVNKSDAFGLADSVTIEFAPDVHVLLIVPVDTKTIDSVGGNNNRALSLMLPGEKGLATTVTQDPKTGDIHVQQKITITTLVSKDQMKNLPSLKKDEEKRVNLFRMHSITAQAKADNLAKEGFKDVESAKKKVEDSTTKEMKDAAREGKLRWDR